MSADNRQGSDGTIVNIDALFKKKLRIGLFYNVFIILVQKLKYNNNTLNVA